MERDGGTTDDRLERSVIESGKFGGAGPGRPEGTVTEFWEITAIKNVACRETSSLGPHSKTPEVKGLRTSLEEERDRFLDFFMNTKPKRKGHGLLHTKTYRKGSIARRLIFHREYLICGG